MKRYVSVQTFSSGAVTNDGAETLWQNFYPPDKKYVIMRYGA